MENLKKQFCDNVKEKIIKTLEEQPEDIDLYTKKCVEELFLYAANPVMQLINCNLNEDSELKKILLEKIFDSISHPTIVLKVGENYSIKHEIYTKDFDMLTLTFPKEMLDIFRKFCITSTEMISRFYFILHELYPEYIKELGNIAQLPNGLLSLNDGKSLYCIGWKVDYI